MATENKTPAQDIADFYHDRYVEHGERVIARLRRMVDDIERDFSHRREGPYREGEYSQKVSGLLHTLEWGKVNLGIEMLVQSASQADIEAMKKLFRQGGE